MGFKISRARMDADNGRVDNANFKQYGETTVSAGSGIAYTVNLATGNTFKITLTANCAISFSNPLSSGTANIFTVILIQDGGSRSVTWPAAVKWASGTAPILATATGAVDTITFMTIDGGTRYFGFPANSTTTAPAASSGYNLFSWGSGSRGALGQGSTTNKSVPTQVGTLSTWSAVKGGGYQSGGAIKTDGSLWMWGNNVTGGSGFGDVVYRSSPSQVGALQGWSLITSSETTTVFLKSDGTLWSTGSNTQGVLGVGNIVDRSSPAQVGTLATWSSISGTKTAILAVRADGTLWSWGSNAHGQLGHGSPAGFAGSRSSPTQIGTLAAWASVAGQVSAYGAVASKTDGTLWGWGGNYQGQLGLGDRVYRSSPVQIGTLTTWSAFVTGLRATLAMKNDGTLWGWGSGALVGLGTTTHRSSPVQIGTLATWSSVGMNGYAGFAIKNDNTLWASGFNGAGQLGLGDTTARYTFTQITSATGWTRVAGGRYNTVFALQDPALRSGRALWVWGMNNRGQLGFADTISRSSPVQLGTGLWSSITGSQYFKVGVKNDGTLWSWGRNNAGELALGDVADRSSPVQVGTLTTWSRAVGSNFGRVAFALKTDSTLWGWGYNAYGQIGVTAYRSSPTQIGTLTWSTVSSGRFDSTVAIRSDGTLWGTGKGTNGILGGGNTTNRTSFVQVGTLATWSSVSVGSKMSGAIKTDGTLWTWGYNRYGTLGLMDTVSRSSPTQVGTLATWAELVNSGVESFIARKTDGTMWSWGRNDSSGNLGLGDRNVSRSSPTQIGTLATWSSLSAGFLYMSAALKSDGSLWVWGAAHYGILGLASTNSRSSPTQVGTLTDWVAPGAVQGNQGGNFFRLQ